MSKPYDYLDAAKRHYDLGVYNVAQVAVLIAIADTLESMSNPPIAIRGTEGCCPLCGLSSPNNEAHSDCAYREGR